MPTAPLAGTATAALSDSPANRIFQLAQVVRTISVGLVLLCARYLPAFDVSASLAAGQPVEATGADLGVLRWDAIHFLSIARDGYTLEQQLAFQPFWPWVLRGLGRAFAAFRELPPRFSGTRQRGEEMSWEVDVGVRDVVLAGSVTAMGAYIGAALMFYRRYEETLKSSLSKLYLPSRLAYRATMLYCFAPTPAVLSSPYSEPLNALATFSGLYFLLTRRSILGAICLAIATSTRATGVFMAPVAAALVLQTSSSRTTGSRILKPALVGGIIVLPFLAFQAYAYLAFCVPEARRPWCSAGMLPYSFVQAEYWNVGLLHYWTFEQVPNLLLALPVLYVSFRGSLTFFSSRRQPSSPASTAMGFRNNAPQSWPLQAHHLLMTLLLLFSSHTQIALRVISGDPTFWWNLASMAFKPCPNHIVSLNSQTPSESVSSEADESELGTPATTQVKPAKGGTKVEVGVHVGDAGVECVRMTRTGKAWGYWAVIWGAVSIVLWAGHYPPA